MNSKKLYYGLLGLLALIILGIIFGAYQADALLENKSKTLVSLKESEISTNNEKAQLAKNKADIATYSSLNTIAKSVVPQDKDQAEAVREIVTLASQSGISQLSSIAFPPSTLGGTTTVKVGNGLTQVTPVKGISGVYELQITITQSSTSPVPFSSFIGFLSKLEQNRRTAQVSSINVQPDQLNPNLVAFTLVINEFIKP